MNKLLGVLVVLVSLFSYPGLAQSMGGQTGSGGNGCWVEDAEHWKSLEEILYQDSFERYDSRDSVWYRNNLFRYLRFGRFVVRAKNYIYETDLRDTPAYRRGLGRLRKLEYHYPHTYKAIRDLYELFGSVYIARTVPAGIFEGSVTEDDSIICDKYSPGILTFKNGTVVFFKEVIDKIDHISTMVLFVHEGIRFAQMFHPAFHELTNQDLELFTTLMFDWSLHEEMKPVLVQIESKLKNRDYSFLPVSGGASPSNRMWRKAINRALKGRGPLSTALLEFRKYNSNFRSESYRSLKEFMKRHR